MRKFNLKGKVVQKLKGLEMPVKGPAASDNATGNGKPGPQEMNTALNGSIRFAWRTDVGKIRKSNQDSVIIGNGLFGVADGMGGHNGGEIASAGLRDGLLRETADKGPSREMLIEAVSKVNHEIWEKQEKDASLTGMGTTLTILWPAEKEMIVGQVGDSRAYLIRDGQMKQITSDHSMVADMVRRGVLTEEQAACHPMRNYITRAVGTDETVETDLTAITRMKGDRWLVCSDGLYGQISRQELEEKAGIPDLEEASDRLLEAALIHGGKDNISFILIQDNEGAEENGEDERDDHPAPGHNEREGATAQ